MYIMTSEEYRRYLTPQQSKKIFTATFSYADVEGRGIWGPIPK
jgi:hypothetical protein